MDKTAETQECRSVVDPDKICYDIFQLDQLADVSSCRTGMGNSRKKFISENEEGAEMKKMGHLQVILMIGCIPMLATMVALTVYASGKMKDELVDSTYLRLKACATSVEQYFTWDIREDILEKDDISYQFIDSLQDEHIEQTLFMEDEYAGMFR